MSRSWKWPRFLSSVFQFSIACVVYCLYSLRQKRCNLITYHAQSVTNKNAVHEQPSSHSVCVHISRYRASSLEEHTARQLIGKRRLEIDGIMLHKLITRYREKTGEEGLQQTCISQEEWDDDIEKAC